MPRLTFPSYLDHLRTESARFREALAGCDPATRVPACPDWDAADLLWHLGRVQWFWATIIEMRPGSVDEDGPGPDRPEGYDALLAAFDDHSGRLASALGEADPTEPAWHWGPEQTVGSSYRRQAHEALVHRVDAEQTAGTPVTALDPALAADGVLEMFEWMYGGEAPEWGRIDHAETRVAVELSDVGQTIWVEPCTFIGTDPGSGEVYDGPHLLVADDPGRPADATLRGSAADLDLWLWNRGTDERIETTGDPDAHDAFRAAVSHPIT